jgi:predicted NAD-dependent protein-ADP-ribosyltransferase YbiA (DUF1768 family)
LRNGAEGEPVSRAIVTDEEFREAIRACKTPYETEALLHSVAGLTEDEKERFQLIWDRMDY